MLDYESETVHLQDHNSALFAWEKGRGAAPNAVIPKEKCRISSQILSVCLNGRRGTVLLRAGNLVLIGTVSGSLQRKKTVNSGGPGRRI